jgi:alanine dehydrogenase
MAGPGAARPPARVHFSASEQAARDDHSLALGVNVHDGQITYGAVAEAFGLGALSLDEVLA